MNSIEGIVLIFAVVFVITFFVAGLIGMRKEGEIRIKYAGVFGRISAYFFLDFVFAAVALIPALAMLKNDITNDFSDVGMTEIMLIAVGSALVLAGFAALIATYAFNRCPEDLRKGMLPSMLLLGLGVTMRFSLRIALFFFPLIWKMGLPGKEDIKLEEQRREREAKENAERAEEYRKHIYRQTGKSPIINNENTKYKIERSDLWEEIPLR